MNLTSALTQYLTWHQTKGHSPRTISSVEARINRFIKYRGNVYVTAVSPQDIHAHFIAMQERGLAAGTLAGHKSTTRAFWKFCKKSGWIKKNPAKVLKSNAHNYSFKPVTRKAAHENDFKTALQALNEFVAHRNFHPLDIRDALIVSITADSSKRRKEIGLLRKDRVMQALERGEQLKSGRIVYHVISGYGKTGQHPIRFYEETAALMRSWLNHLPPIAEFIFIDPRTGKRLHIDYMANAFKRLCKFANIPPFRFQATRKRVVTNAIQAGSLKTGQVIAGHKDERTTQVYYQEIQAGEVDTVGADLADDVRGNGRLLIDEFFKQK